MPKEISGKKPKELNMQIGLCREGDLPVVQ